MGPRYRADGRLATQPQSERGARIPQLGAELVPRSDSWMTSLWSIEEAERRLARCRAFFGSSRDLAARKALRYRLRALALAIVHEIEQLAEDDPTNEEGPTA